MRADAVALKKANRQGAKNTKEIMIFMKFHVFHGST